MVSLHSTPQTSEQGILGRIAGRFEQATGINLPDVDLSEALGRGSSTTTLQSRVAPEPPPNPVNSLLNSLTSFAKQLWDKALDSFRHSELGRLTGSEREAALERIRQDPVVQAQIQELEKLRDDGWIAAEDANALIEKLSRPQNFDLDDLEAWVPPAKMREVLDGIYQLQQQGLSKEEIQFRVALGYQRGGAEGVAQLAFTAGAEVILDDLGWELSRIRHRFSQLDQPSSELEEGSIFHEIRVLEEQQARRREAAALAAIAEAQTAENITPIQGDGFTLYKQGDYGQSYGGYGTIASSGCAPTSMAIAFSMLGIRDSDGTDINPVEMANFAASNGFRVPGSGTSWAFFASAAQRHGVQAENIGGNLDAIDAHLALGRPVVISTDSMPFTEGGHILVVYGKDSSGNYLFADPGPRNVTSTDSETFRRALVNAWSIY